MDFDRLTKLVEQRNHALNEQKMYQKWWDEAAEKMNTFGASILEEENKIKHLEAKIEELANPQPEISIAELNPTFYRYMNLACKE